jgi:hypothetical protein
MEEPFLCLGSPLLLLLPGYAAAPGWKTGALTGKLDWVAEVAKETELVAVGGDEAGEVVFRSLITL